MAKPVLSHATSSLGVMRWRWREDSRTPDSGEQCSEERLYRWGIDPQSRRNIFPPDHSPQSATNVQVSLFVVLQESRKPTNHARVHRDRRAGISQTLPRAIISQRILDQQALSVDFPIQTHRAIGHIHPREASVPIFERCTVSVCSSSLRKSKR